MKKYFPFLFLIGCAGTTAITVNPVKPVPEITVIDTIRKSVNIVDTVLHMMFVQDTLAIPISEIGEINIKDFGAKCDGVTDDFIADSSALAFAIANPKLVSTVVFPVGVSKISKTISLHPSIDQFCTIHIKGMLPAKEASNSYLSQLYFTNKSGPGISISGGRGIVIENLSIQGQYHPPAATSANIGLLRWADWNDATVSDSRYAPYAGIVIDPDQDYPGTSGVEIRQCRIINWVSGIALSPGGGVNDDMINLIDNDIEQVKISYVVCQDQNKEINIIRPKCAAACHTFLDCVSYGDGTGGDVSVQDGCLAGAMNELVNARTDRFNITFTGTKVESLFRIGTVGGNVGSNFINCRFDFLTGAGWPEPDFMISGIANFYGGMLRYYDNDKYHRLNLVNMRGMFRDMTLGNYPLVRGLIGWPAQNYPTAQFCNVNNYYNQSHSDTLIRITPPSYLYTDSVKWISTASAPGLGSIAKVGDYLLGGSSGGWGLYYDRYLNPNGCPTIIIGQVQSISNDTLYMNHVAVNAPENRGFDNIFLSRLK